MSPCHILPLAPIGVVLEIKVPHAILIEHPIGVVHPAPYGRMMIDGTEFLPIGGVECVRILDVLPAGEVLDGIAPAALAVEEDVEQDALPRETGQVEGHIVVYIIHSQPAVELFHDLIALQNTDMGIVLALLYGQKQEMAVSTHFLHGMLLPEECG